MHKKTIYSFFILVGAVILFYGKKSNDTFLSYLSILGFVILMFGLYKVSTVLVKDRTDDQNEDL